MIRLDEAIEVVFVPFPERAGDVLDTAGRNFDERSPLVYWTTPDRRHPFEIILTDHSGPAIRYVRDHEQPLGGPWAWRRHDPAHPRCWYCGKFTGRRDRRYTPPCSRCGELPTY